MSVVNKKLKPGSNKSAKPRRRGNTLSGCNLGCLLMIGGIGYVFFLILLFLTGIYLFSPFQTNLVILGIDHTKPSNYVGRSDTIMLVSFDPSKSSINLLSIPRDLWVPIPGYGENRINTAHFFAEAQLKGSGPQALMDVLRLSFGFRSDYYLRIKFENFREIVDSMGGIDIELKEPVAGYPAGRHHLNGRKALAFARNRTGSDDFFRMERGQFLLRAALNNLKNPTKWVRIPTFLLTFYKSIDTNLPVWHWPRLAFLLLRFGNDLNNRSITREMITPYTTEQSANVLIPDWLMIKNLVTEMFGE